MDKMIVAHEYAMQLVASPDFNDNMTLEEFVKHVWKYADLMQEECDKRNNARLENNKKLLEDTENKLWQPDWSVAPDNMLYFAVDKNGEGWFFNKEPHIERDNCWYCGDNAFKIKQHNYKGDWRQSLKERPKDNKVESGYVQQIPRPFLVNGCDVGNLDVLKEGLCSGLKEASKEIPTKVEVKIKQHSCNCPHWKGSSFCMGDTFTCNDCGGVVMI